MRGRVEQAERDLGTKLAPTRTDPKGRNLETGGEVWVLLIKTLKTSDSGAYICELNSDDVLRSIHILTGKLYS